MIWRYFAWCNQTLAVFTLWAITVYLAQKKKLYWVTLIPALFMTTVTITYILYDPIGINLSYNLSVSIGIGMAIISGIYFFLKLPKLKNAQ